MTRPACGRIRGPLTGAEAALRHGAIGRGVDSVISFPRKLATDLSSDGWFPWSTERPLGALQDRDGEYARYLRDNLAADEFRANDEAWRRFLDPAGKLDPEMLAGLQERIAPLVEPSAERALALNKAYRLLVAEQSFTKGRLAVLEPLDATVHRYVEPETPTGVTSAVRAY